MEGSGRHIIPLAAAAFALSGCSFFLLSYLRDRASFSKPINPNKTLISSLKHRSYSVKGGRKHVRFVGVEESQNDKKKPEEGEAKTPGKSPERKKERVSLPENWRRLYSGMNRYRSQQATLLLYA